MLSSYIAVSNITRRVRHYKPQKKQTKREKNKQLSKPLEPNLKSFILLHFLRAVELYIKRSSGGVVVGESWALNGRDGTAEKRGQDLSKHAVRIS